MNARYLVVIGIIAAMTTVAFYSFGILHPDLFKQNANWGDFAGGSLGPVLTFFGFLGLLYTIKIQSDELSLTREELSRSASALETQSKELKKQSFENTFFKMLEFHASIVNNFHVTANNQNLNGRDCFTYYYNRLSQALSGIRLIDGGKLPSNFSTLYSQYWHSYGHNLGHYYRYFYRFVRFTSENSDNSDVYMKLIRAQCTDLELILLFYNSNSEIGRKFKSLLDASDFFDNLRPELYIVK